MGPLTEATIRSKAGNPGTAVLVSMNGTSAATTAALTDGQLYVITCPQPYHYVSAATPTATTNSSWWPANVPNYVTGAGVKLAFIKPSGGTDATVYITPLYGYRV